MSHIFREHLFYIEVYNREYAGIPLAGYLIQVCPTIYVFLPKTKMTIIILQIKETYTIDVFPFIHIFTKIKVIFLNGRHIICSFHIQSEFPKSLKQCTSIKHTFIAIVRIKDFSSKSIMYSIIIIIGRRSHALLYHTNVNSILPQQRTFIIEETQLIIESHPIIFYFVVSENKIFVMHTSSHDCVYRKLYMTHRSTVLTHHYQFTLHVMNQIYVVITHTEQRASGPFVCHLTSPLQPIALEARHSQRTATGKAERALAVGVKTGKI